MPAAIALAAAMIGAQSAPCDFDRERMMALSQLAFDQDRNGGWRVVARQPGCRRAAADLIRDYRRERRDDWPPLLWHEGQLRALEGETAAAVALMERSRSGESDPIGWNHYLDATVAFLRNDRSTLLAARERLATLPRPADFTPRAANGQSATIRWPLNLNVVDSLIRCFGRPYAEAYRPHCGRDEDPPS